MKKSLVISTIATVLVVVVALTTATFAWFTAGSVSQASANFTLSTAGGAIQITTWDKTQGDEGGWSAAPYSGGTTVPLGGYNQSYEFSADIANGAFETTDALTSYKPLAPKEEIVASTLTSVAETPGEAGLPGIKFINAQQQGSQINVVNADARPVVARFKLDTIEDALDGQISVTISVTGGAPTTSYTAANGLRFVLIGTSAAPSETAQSFTFGTAYSYVTNTGGAAIDATGAITPKYEPVKFTDNLTGSALVKQANFPTVDSNNAIQTQTLDFKMTAGVSVECVLYVWFDGQTVTNTASAGEVSFLLNFVKKTQQTP